MGNRFAKLDTFASLVSPQPEPEHTPTPAVTPTPTRERKTTRLQLVLRKSTIDRLAQYAADHDTSRNDITQKLLDKFLDEQGY